MSRQDFHRKRIIPIEFKFVDNLDTLPYDKRLTLVLVTNGEATLSVNEKFVKLLSPCAFLISKYDNIKLVSKADLRAKSFSFEPSFIKSCLKFENLNDKVVIDESFIFIRQMLYMFVNHFDTFQGVLELTPNTYMRLNEVLSIIGTETYSQSDKYWSCRIRRLLNQMLHMLYDVFTDQRKLNFYDKPQRDCVDICIEYIHTNFQKEIHLDDLCKISNLNRTSLNSRFKERVNFTVMDYLLDYRIKIACEALAHTNLKLSKIAESCGFKYDNYFIKIFTKKMSISPTEYRNNIWKLK